MHRQGLSPVSHPRYSHTLATTYADAPLRLLHPRVLDLVYASRTPGCLPSFTPARHPSTLLDTLPPVHAHHTTSRPYLRPSTRHVQSALTNIPRACHACRACPPARTAWAAVPHSIHAIAESLITSSVSGTSPATPLAHHAAPPPICAMPHASCAAPAASRSVLVCPTQPCVCPATQRACRSFGLAHRGTWHNLLHGHGHARFGRVLSPRHALREPAIPASPGTNAPMNCGKR